MRLLSRSLLLLACALALPATAATSAAQGETVAAVVPLINQSVLGLVQTHGTVVTMCVGLEGAGTVLGTAIQSCAITVSVDPDVRDRLGLPTDVVATGAASTAPGLFGSPSYTNVYLFFTAPAIAALASLRQDVVLHFVATVTDPSGGVSAPRDTPMTFSGMATVNDCPLKSLPTGVTCWPWRGKQTSDGTPGGVTGVGWPAITGLRWEVTADASPGERIRGTYLNDALLGRHGSDTLLGGDGDDVVWGDAAPGVVVATQQDRIEAGAGSDWITTSAGTNDVSAGAGNDHVVATTGHGKINCGTGKDVVRIHVKGAYALRNCEKVAVER